MSRPYWLEIQRPALLWTLFSLPLSFSTCGSHTEHAYSRPDLTNVMYVKCLTQKPIAQDYIGHGAVGLLLWTPPVCTEGNRLQTNGSWSIDPRGQVGH